MGHFTFTLLIRLWILTFTILLMLRSFFATWLSAEQHGLEALLRLELRTIAYKAIILPLNYKAIGRCRYHLLRLRHYPTFFYLKRQSLVPVNSGSPGSTMPILTPP